MLQKFGDVLLDPATVVFIGRNAHANPIREPGESVYLSSGHNAVLKPEALAELKAFLMAPPQNQVAGDRSLG